MKMKMKMKMKKILNMVFLQIAIICLIGISGCREEPSEDKDIIDEVYEEVNDLGGDYILTVMHSQKVLGVSSDNPDNSNIFQQSRLEEIREHQVWTLRFLDDNSYVITSKETGKALTVEGASVDAGASAIQQTFVQDSSQKFKIFKAFNKSHADQNTYTITNVNSDMVLSVEGSSTEENMGIEQQKYQLEAQQQWQFEVAAVDPNPYQVGKSHFGERNFIEYVRGDLPIIIIAPHGGKLRPDDLPVHSTHVGDGRTAELAVEVVNNIFDITGRRPHLVINHIKSNRLNANRKKKFAAGDNPDAQNAFDEFHGFIDYAKDEVTHDFGGGHLFDMHTNAHSASWAENGQLVSKSALNRGDDAIRNTLSRSSVRQMVEGLGLDYIEITKGQTSLGGFLQSRGIKSVPSPRHPSPGAEGYFNGGWNTARHGSRYGGVINATQIENPAYRVNKRDPALRARYSKDLAWSIMDFMTTHYATDLTPPEGRALIPVHDSLVRDGTDATKNYGRLILSAVNNGSTPNDTRISYFKFDLSSIDDTVQSAKLRFIVESTSENSEHYISFVSDDSWLEKDITFQNKPEIGMALDYQPVPNGGGIIEFDVTSQVETEAMNDKVISFAIQEVSPRDGITRYHNSKSAGKKPLLIIE